MQVPRNVHIVPTLAADAALEAAPGVRMIASMPWAYRGIVQAVLKVVLPNREPLELSNNPWIYPQGGLQPPLSFSLLPR